MSNQSELEGFKKKVVSVSYSVIQMLRIQRALLRRCSSIQCFPIFAQKLIRQTTQTWGQYFELKRVKRER